MIDSIQCISILLENPPQDKEYRVVNQFDEQYNITQLAHKIQSIGNKKGLNVEIKNIDNPRLENEKNYYKADHDKLRELGFQATRSIDDEIELMLDNLIKFKDRVLEKKDSIIREFKWQQ